MKNLQSILFVFIVVVLCFGFSLAQEKKTKVLKYFAPKYPAAGQAVRATGAVIIAVKIDKDGKVISFNAESGHPLLRRVSENAAREWLFSNDLITEEREVKITFLFRIGDKNKKEKVKFRKSYTLEIIGVQAILSAAGYQIHPI